MTKDQLIQIAKVGFPDRVKQFINFEDCEIYESGNVHRLYDKNEEFLPILPKKEHLSILIRDGIVQIMCGNKVFNHYAAIKEMEKMGLISPKEKEEVNNKPLKKPPLGLIPKHIHNEKVAKERLKEIAEAIGRYKQAGLVVSSEWIKEWDELLDKFREERNRGQKKEDMKGVMDDINKTIKLASEYGLETEVIASTMFFLQEKNGASISDALKAGLNDWDI